MKIKKRVLQKVVSVFASVLLLVNSFSPFLLIAPSFSQVKAQTETVTPTPTAEPTLVPIEVITPIPTAEPTVVPTETATPTPTVTPEPIPPQAPSQWTFEKVELNKEYVAPQNSEVKLTFTKLPDPAGNIKIEEITLTEDQIKQTGSLSDKAYDITSDMKDGDFSYNLSLPIPESSKGESVEVKFAEELSNIGSAEKVDNTLTKTDTSVSVSSLDHMTIFVVSNPSPPPTNYLQNIIDNSDTGFEILSGTWRTSNSVAGSYGTNYVTTDNHTGVGQIRWNFVATQSGNQQIFTRWTSAANRGTSVPFTVTYDGGSATVSVNQELNNSTWMSLGTYSFTEGNPYSVTLTNNSSSTNDFVIGDAIKLENVSDPSVVYVDDDWSGTSSGSPMTVGSNTYYFGFNAFSKIQDAVVGVATDGTINVDAGTYTEIGQIIINKNLSIVGADKITTIVKPAQDTGSSGDLRGWFLVNSGKNFTLKNITLDGTGHKVFQAIRSHGPSDIEDNVIKNMLYDPSTSYEGRGIVVYDGFSSNILNNTLENIGRIGIFIYGAGTEAFVKGNNYTGKGAGDWLDYGVEVGGGGQATVEENNISNCKGIASVDNSVSAGVLATTYWDSGTNIKLINNSINDNSYGVTLGYNDGITDDTTSVLQFDGNIFTNNDHDFDNYTVNNIDARNNTWSVVAQDNLDQIEAKINHNCSNSIYVHGICSGSDDYSTGGMVRYKDIGEPTNSGWNVQSKSLTPNETALDIACGGYSNENSVAQNWTVVSGSNIKYQREVTYPSNSVVNIEAGSNTYTPFVSFGGNPGIEGLWKTRVRAYVDANNNNIYDSGEEVSGWSSECKITYDKTVPTVPINGTPNGTSISTNNFDFNWDDSADNTPITYIFQSTQNPASSGDVLTTGLWTSGTLPTSMIHSSGAGDGKWYWQVKAKDAAGNESAWSQIWNVTLDTIAPAIPGNPNPPDQNYKNTHDFTFSWDTITDPSSPVSYEWEFSYGTAVEDDGSFTSRSGFHSLTSASVNSPGTPDNIYYWHVRAIDSLGNASAWSSTWKVTVDTTAPVIELHEKITVEATSSLGAAVTYTAPDATDNVDATAPATCVPPPGSTFPIGITTVTCNKTDTAGNVAISTTFQIKVEDTTAPTTPTATPIAGDYTSDQSVTLLSSDSGSGLATIYYTTDGSTPNNTKTHYTGAITVDHDTTIKAIAYDNAGNTSDILEATYGIPPKISAETSSLATTSTATVTWTTDDPSTSRVIYDTVSHPGVANPTFDDPFDKYGYANTTDEFDTLTKVTSHSVGLTGLTAGTTYYYRTISHGSPEAVSDEHSVGTSSFVSTTNGGGGGGTSNPSAPVCNDQKPGNAPFGLTAVAGLNSVTLTWNKASDPVSYYLMTFGTSPGSQTYGNPNIGNKDTTSYTVSGLSGGTTYYFKVRAGNGCMPGDFSNEASAAPSGGFIEGVPAGFEAGVLGEATKSAELTEELTGEPTPTTTVINAGLVKGIQSIAKNKSFKYIFPIILIILLGALTFYFYKKRSS